MSYTGEALIDTYGPRSISLDIDDFNNNSITGNVITIKEDADTFEKPYGIEDCSLPIIQTNGSRFLEGLDVGLCRPPKNPEHPAVDENGNLVQAMNQQMYWAKIQKKHAWQLSANRITPNQTSGCFARLQVIKNDGPVIFVRPRCCTKNYLGPVDISRLKVRLFDEHGFPLDLNGQQWSVQLEAESIYQI